MANMFWTLLSDSFDCQHIAQCVLGYTILLLSQSLGSFVSRRLKWKLHPVSEAFQAASQFEGNVRETETHLRNFLAEQSNDLAIGRRKASGTIADIFADANYYKQPANSYLEPRIMLHQSYAQNPSFRRPRPTRRTRSMRGVLEV